MNWHALKEEEVLKYFKTKKEGLNSEEAQKRLRVCGKNELKKLKKLNTLKLFFSQFASFLIIILFIAAIISLSLKHWLDFGVIIGIVILNSLFGFFQEYKAERALEKLKEMLVPKTKVFRNNAVIEIDSREIVPGDLLVLEEGDNIPADLRILQSENLQVDESALTGESTPSDKQAEVLSINTSLADRKNILYQGTEVVMGKCRAIVVSTGMNTEFGKIAQLVQEVKPEKSPFKKSLDKFAKKLGVVILLIITIISLIGFMFGLDKLQIFLTAVSLAVSAIPEGLPAVITITLALAAQRMSRVNTLVRKLPSAETLGRVTIIATDKTGTITEGKMNVTKIYVNKKIFQKFERNKETSLLFKIGILCNNARHEGKQNQEGQVHEYLVGDPTEKAILLAAKNYGLEKKELTEKHPRVKEFSFSSNRKMMSIVRKNERGGYTSYVKGAPEILIKKSKAELINGKIILLSTKRKEELHRDYEKMASMGLRVLAFAYKNITAPENKITEERAESGLIFVGYQGMIDSPRPEVKSAIKSCSEAGIKVIMLTGDSPLTAKAVGEEIGLKGEVILSEQLRRMSDQQVINHLKTVSIFARVSPEDKLRMVNILKENKEIVAVTGDGVNDAPALKKADIGIAVGRGTDVAKDASEMVLLDNNFASIVKAIKEGRRIDDNVGKFVSYMFGANFYEVLIVLSAILLRLPLPLLPLQILWINLITDSFPSVSLSTEYAEEDIMKRKPSKGSLFAKNYKKIITAGLLLFLAGFFLFYLEIENIDKARTMATTFGVLFELFIVFSFKSNNLAFKSRFNKYIFYAILLSLGLHLLVLYTPLNNLFNFVSLGIFDWVKILSLCIIGFFILEGIKLIKKDPTH